MLNANQQLPGPSQEGMAPQQLVMGDNIKQLPVNKTPPTSNEIHLAQNLFAEPPHRNTMSIIFEEGKEAIVTGFLFIIFSLPQLDNLFHKSRPVTSKSIYLLLFLKGLLFIMIWWVIKYFYLARKDT